MGIKHALPLMRTGSLHAGKWEAHPCDVQVSDVLSNRLGWGRPFVSSLRAEQLPGALGHLEWWWHCVLRGWVCRCVPRLVDTAVCMLLDSDHDIQAEAGMACPGSHAGCRRAACHAHRLLALLSALLSVAVVVAEATISPYIPNLSLFSQALHEAAGNELATELAAFVFLVSRLRPQRP